MENLKINVSNHLHPPTYVYIPSTGVYILSQSRAMPALKPRQCRPAVALFALVRHSGDAKTAATIRSKPLFTMSKTAGYYVFSQRTKKNIPLGNDAVKGSLSS